MANPESLFKNEEAEKLKPIEEHQRRAVMDYLIQSSDGAITSEDWGPDGAKIGEREEVLAKKLLLLQLFPKDSARSRRYDYPESNYKPDMEKRSPAFKQAGLEGDEIKIARHNIVLEGLGELWTSIKILDLETRQPTREEEDRGVSVKMIPGGTILLGKVILNDSNHPVEAGKDRYVPLTEEEKVELEQLLDK